MNKYVKYIHFFAIVFFAFTALSYYYAGMDLKSATLSINNPYLAPIYAQVFLLICIPLIAHSFILFGRWYSAINAGLMLYWIIFGVLYYTLFPDNIKIFITDSLGLAIVAGIWILGPVLNIFMIIKYRLRTIKI